MELTTYLSFVIAATLLILIPGPTVITIISDTLNGGSAKAIKTIFGAAVAHTCYIVFTAFGINKLLLLSMDYFIALKWVGAGYLILMGIRKFISSKKGALVKKDNDQPSNRFFMRGFLVTIGNPKAMIFYATFFPPFLNPSLRLDVQYLIFGSTFLVIFILLSLISSVVMQRTVSAIISDKKQTLVNRISGGLMIGAGALLASIKRS